MIIGLDTIPSLAQYVAVIQVSTRYIGLYMPWWHEGEWRLKSASVLWLMSQFHQLPFL